MEILPSEKKYLIKNIVKPLFHHLLLSSILEGKTRSTIYVDDIEHPKFSIVWVKGKLYLLGKPRNNLPQQVEKMVETKYYKYLRKYNANSFTVFFNQDWKPSLKKMFSGQIKQEYVRSYFHLKLDSYSPITTTRSRNVQIIPITDDLLSTPYMNIELVKEEMCSERYTIIDFLEKSFGFVAVDDGKVVSWCMSEYNSRSRCELGIETVKRYQRKGYATLVADTVIKHAMKMGVKEIGWHCWKQNIPSVKTALKLGFLHKKDYDILHLRI